MGVPQKMAGLERTILIKRYKTDDFGAHQLMEFRVFFPYHHPMCLGLFQPRQWWNCRTPRRCSNEAAQWANHLMSSPDDHCSLVLVGGWAGHPDLKNDGVRQLG